jgi:Uma2 family endonuclease
VALNRPAIVPDVLVKTNVEIHQNPWEKDHRAYFAWTYDGKPPDVVIEIVSNTKGGELDAKLRNYQQIGVPWYAVYDPEQHLGERLLTVFSLSNTGRRMLEGDPVMFGGLELGVKLWEGTFEGITRLWLRWCDADGNILLTGNERAAALAAKLRELGVDPASI